MKKSFDELKLVDAALADEGWESCHDEIASAGLAALRGKKRSRHRLLLGVQVLGLLTAFAAAWWCLNGLRIGPGSQRVQMGDDVLNLTRTGLQADALRAADGSRARAAYITEEQMLAMFPKGSCVVAEVNGEKQLVFLDEGSAGERFRTTQ
jgi:hypothetical protein